MSRKEFEEFLYQKEEEQKGQPTIDWKKEKEEWLKYLELLYNIFEDSLKDYKESVQIAYELYTINEEYIGTYHAKGANILVAGRVIRLKPIGTNLVGAKGRVDMSSSKGSVTLLLVDSRINSMRDQIQINIFIDTYPNDHIQPNNMPKHPIKWEWRFVSPPPLRHYIPVNEETIYSTIMDLI